jgi:hypothetical protein
VLAGCDLDRELDTANKALNWRDAQAAMMLNNL